MNLLKSNINKTIIGLLCVLLISSSLSIGSSQISEKIINNTYTETNLVSPPYKGTLRIFIVEPYSRWDMNNNQPYHYAFLDFALDESISIPYTESYQSEVTWNPEDSGYPSSSISETNIMAIAAVYNQESTQRYANPPFQYPFDAHLIDATAAATPRDPGMNEKTEDYTHTGLIEEATATWCPYCPAMANALYDIHKDDDFPFYFVAMVSDKSDTAGYYLQDTFNLYAYPSAFMDGGDRVIVGGYSDKDFYTSRLEKVLTRDVHDLDLSIELQFNEDATLTITVDITNNEEIPNTAPTTPSITGEIEGKKGTDYEYMIECVDGEDNNVFYRIDWGDGETTDWFGPYESGEEISLNHNWTEQGEYEIRVQAKDIHDYESDWGTLSVSMPNQKSIYRNQPFQQLISFLRTLFQKIMINENTPPNPPEIIGPTEGKINDVQRYSFFITDPDDDQLLKMEIDFGDETLLEPCGCTNAWINGTIVDISHIWEEQGTYAVTARVMDENNAWSEWSEPFTVSMPYGNQQIRNDQLMSFLEK
jgi:thiol-disulfide isomerase/thioredoxin